MPAIATDPVLAEPDGSRACARTSSSLGDRTSCPASSNVAGALDVLDQAAAAFALPEVADLIGRLVSIEERARLRLRQAADPGAVLTAPDDNLSAADAARRLGMSRDWLYRNARRLPFAGRIGRRVVFSARGLERWNQQRLVRPA